MYYSVIPYAHILLQQCAQQEEKPPVRMMTEHSGVTMEVSVLSDGRRRIERLYATDLRSYLDKNYQIGTIL